MIPENVEKALTSWIFLDGWHTGNPLALGRYFDFVTTLCEARFMDEALLLKAIHQEIETHHPTFDQEERERLVDHFVELADRIYRYKVSRNFKDLRGVGASCWWCP